MGRGKLGAATSIGIGSVKRARCANAAAEKAAAHRWRQQRNSLAVRVCANGRDGCVRLRRRVNRFAQAPRLQITRHSHDTSPPSFRGAVTRRLCSLPKRALTFRGLFDAESLRKHIRMAAAALRSPAPSRVVRGTRLSHWWKGGSTRHGHRRRWRLHCWTAALAARHHMPGGAISRAGRRFVQHA